MSQDLLNVEAPRRRPDLQAGELTRLEEQWANRQATLEKAGYMLRQRYRPGWKPSWIGTSKFFMDVEDGQAQPVPVSVGRSLETFWRYGYATETSGHGCQPDF